MGLGMLACPGYLHNQSLRRAENSSIDCCLGSGNPFTWAEAKLIGHQLQVRTGNGNGSLLVGADFRKVFRAEFQIDWSLPISIWEAVCRFFSHSLGKQLGKTKNYAHPSSLILGTTFPLTQPQWSSLSFLKKLLFCFTAGDSYKLFLLPGILSLDMFCWLIPAYPSGSNIKVTP